MAKTRSELREKCMIILYQWDLFKNSNSLEDINNIIKNNMDITNDFVEKIVYGVIEHVEKLDNYANQNMRDWTIDRIDKTGKAILRIALYELMFTDTPEVVVINEAVELAKKYSDESVRKIINAVLDRYIKD